jgi:hypothetical protein
MWWLTPVILVLGMLRLEDHTFGASLGRLHGKSISQKKKKKMLVSVIQQECRVRKGIEVMIILYGSQPQDISGFPWRLRECVKEDKVTFWLDAVLVSFLSL